MTQEEFARRIGISQNYLSTMEHGNVQIPIHIDEPDIVSIHAKVKWRVVI